MESKKIINEKKLYKRLIMSHWDLMQALKFIDIILKRYNSRSNSKEDEQISVALSIAAVVTYWKPFSKNKSNKNKFDSDAKPKLHNKSIKNFNDQELKLHQRIMTLRNSDFAHSDPVSHGLEVYVKKTDNQNIFTPAGRNMYVPMEKSDLILLKGMIRKILEWISKERQRIVDILDIDGNF